MSGLFRLFPILCLFLLPSALCGQLTRAIDIRTLPLERAIAGEPVHLTGTVGFVDSPGTVFIQDATGGTFFRPKREVPELQLGDVVEVRGTTVSGLYVAGIDPTEWKVIGREAPPAPQHATYEDLTNGRYHYQRVSVEGIGRRLSTLEEKRSLLHVVMGGRVIEVRIDASMTDLPLIDARLRITGLAAGGINDRRQLVSPYLRVADWKDVTILEPAPPVESLPTIPATRLLRFGQPDIAFHRVRVKGTVLAHFEDGRLFIRDDASKIPEVDPASKANENVRPSAAALAIRLSGNRPLTPGQRVEVAGFPSMEGFSASLADAEVIKAEGSERVEPMPLTPAQLLNGFHDADLVTLPGELSEVFRTAEGFELHLKSNQTPINAILPANAASGELTLEPGSQLQLTGICQIEASSDKGYRSRPDRASLLLRNWGDVQILSTPSWWTSTRLLAAISILLGIILLGMLWIIGLRVQVRRQALALRARIFHEAALDERHRIAREFHDTLEQELAGLSLRLDAALTRPLEDKAHRLLETSRHLVSRIQSEARDLVADLRSDPNATADVATAFAEISDRWQTEGAPALQIEVSPSISPLPAHLVHHLRMIATEAVTNALKHAQANNIRIRVTQENSGGLQLSICDDGKGIQATETQGRPGHFGCMGIRERCRKIGAQVTWRTTQPGTCVEVVYPDPSNPPPHS